MNGKQYVFKFECSQKWEDLTATDDEKVRYCGQCGNNVFSVKKNEELNSNAEKGNCIYFPPMRTAGIPFMPDEADKL
ncbi:MAG TPA: hypothetical protein PKY59_02665 [Pyrinomonadaceae bacterium]|nr:hypothetical protein [Pyrinomonadaceae bacterium]